METQEFINEVIAYRNLQYQALGEREPWSWKNLSEDERNSWIDRYEAIKELNKVDTTKTYAIPDGVEIKTAHITDEPQTTQRESPFEDYVVTKKKTKKDE